MGTSSPFFIPPNLLPSIGLNTQDKVCKSSQSRPPASSQPLRHQICDDWSWHDDCNSEYCPKLHICIVCKCPDHQSQSLPPQYNINSTSPLTTRILPQSPADYFCSSWVSPLILSAISISSPSSASLSPRIHRPKPLPFKTDLVSTTVKHSPPLFSLCQCLLASPSRALMFEHSRVALTSDVIS